MTDTILIAAINIVANTSSNLIDPTDPAPLTSASIAEREYGSKMYGSPYRPCLLMQAHNTIHDTRPLDAFHSYACVLTLPMKGSRCGADANRDHMVNEGMPLDHV